METHISRTGHDPGDLGPPRRRGVPVRRADGASPATTAQRVVCVTATRGELGTPDPVTWPPDRLAAERTLELASCLAILGVHEHHWLDYRDGGCAAADAGRRRRAAVRGHRRVRPDTVLTFGPDGFTGHPDHRAVAAWAAAAFDRAAPPGARLLQAAVARAAGGAVGRAEREPGRLPAGLPDRHPGRPTGGRPGAGPGDRRPQGPGAGRAADPDRRPDRDARPRHATPPGSARSRSSSGAPAAPTRGRWSGRSPTEVPVDGVPGDREHLGAADRPRPAAAGGRRGRRSSAGASGARSAAASSSAAGLVVAEPAQQVGQVPQRRSTGGSSCRSGRSSRRPRGTRVSASRIRPAATRTESSPTVATPTRKVAPDARARSTARR